MSRQPASIKCTKKLAKYTQAFGWDTTIIKRTGEQQRALGQFTPDFISLLKRRLQAQARDRGVTPKKLRSKFDVVTTETQSYLMLDEELSSALADLGIELIGKDLECVMLDVCENPEANVSDLVVDWREFLRIYLPNRSLRPLSPAFFKIRSRVCACVIRHPSSLSTLSSLLPPSPPTTTTTTAQNIQNEETTTGGGGGGGVSRDVFFEALTKEMRIHVNLQDFSALCLDLQTEAQLIDVSLLIEGLDVIHLLLEKLREAGDSFEHAHIFQNHPSTTDTKTKKSLESALEALGLQNLSRDQKNAIFDQISDANEMGIDLVAQAKAGNFVPCCVVKIPTQYVTSENEKNFSISLAGVTFNSSFELVVTDSQGEQVCGSGTIEFDGDFDLPLLDLSKLCDGELTVTIVVTPSISEQSKANISEKIEKHSLAPNGYLILFDNDVITRSMAESVPFSIYSPIDEGTFELTISHGNETKTLTNSFTATKHNNSSENETQQLPPFHFTTHVNTQIFPDICDLQISICLIDKYNNKGEKTPFISVAKNTTCPRDYSITCRNPEEKDVSISTELGMKIANLMVVDFVGVGEGWVYELVLLVGKNDAKKVLETHSGTVTDFNERNTCTVNIPISTTEEIECSLTMSSPTSPNKGDTVTTVFNPVISRVPQVPLNVLFATRHGNNLTVCGICENEGGEPISHLNVFAQKNGTNSENFQTEVEVSRREEIEGGGVRLMGTFSDSFFAGEHLLDVKVTPRNGVGLGKPQEIQVHHEQVITVEIAVGGLSKKNFGSDLQLSVRKALCDIFGEQYIPDPSFVVLVSVADLPRDVYTDLPPSPDALIIELEIEPSCLFSTEKNLSTAQHQISSNTQQIVENLQSRDVSKNASWIRVVSQPKRVLYARIGWLQVKVCRAAKLFREGNEREAQMTLTLGSTTKKTKNLAVFKEEEFTVWNESFEFEHVGAKDQILEFAIWSKKKPIETCRLDMVKDLSPGLTNVFFSAGSGVFELQCTYHPRSQAGREASKAKHVVHTQ